MSLLEAFKLVLSFMGAVKRFLLAQKKQELISTKNESLEKGDQRELEKALSEDKDCIKPLPIGKYNGMFERSVKKKP